MSGLGRRVDALEAIAEAIRYRPHRALAAERGLDPDALIAECKKLEAMRDHLRAAGLTEREIIQQTAARMGITVDELQRRVDELLERFG